MYNFDKVAKFQNSLKWHVNDSELPMTLGDMDFEVAPEIITELHKRIENKNFGYEYIPYEYYVSVAKWYKENMNITIAIKILDQLMTETEPAVQEKSSHE